MTDKPKTTIDRIALPILGILIGLYWSFAFWLSWNWLLVSNFPPLHYVEACGLILLIWMFIPSVKEETDIIADAELAKRPELKEKFDADKGTRVFMMFFFKPTAVIIISFLLSLLT